MDNLPVSIPYNLAPSRLTLTFTHADKTLSYPIDDTHMTAWGRTTLSVNTLPNGKLFISYLDLDPCAGDTDVSGGQLIRRAYPQPTPSLTSNLGA